MRRASVKRKTKETSIELELDVDGTGEYDVDTGIKFFDHLLEQVAAKGLFDLRVRAKCVDRFDEHHLVEDVGIALGEALDRALGDRRGINRYGSAFVPMDESLGFAAVDASGRGKLAYDAEVRAKKVQDLSVEMVEHFFESFAGNARLTLHVRLMYGRNSHHAMEGLCKAAGRALRQAFEADARVKGVPSTKGRL